MPLIAAEDTRLSRRLLDRHGIDDPDDQLPRPERAGAAGGPPRRTCAAATTSRSSPTRARRVVSDPGADLVAAWAAEGGRVVPIPGASAVLAAVAAYRGRPGRAGRSRGSCRAPGASGKDRLAAIAADVRGPVIYEAPGPGGGHAPGPGRGLRPGAGRRPCAGS